MTDKWEQRTAIALVGMAGFQIWDAWNKNAPSLEQVRQAPPKDDMIRQRLMDAEITVGSLALVLGVVFAILTHDMTAMIVMLGIFAALAWLHHWILASQPV
jgi:hypothetical protein